MTVTELRERLKKAVEKCEKCVKTIERHEAQAQKKLDKIIANGWDASDRYKYGAYGSEPNHDAYWAVCEYENKLNDIENAKKKLADAERIMGNWSEKLYKQVQIEKTIEEGVPTQLKEMQAELANVWYEGEIEHRDTMKAKRRQMDYVSFCRMYSARAWEDAERSDEQVKKEVERDARDFVIDLYNRIKHVTGNVTDWAGIHWKGKALNGVVAGDHGTAKVETIMAGGYNIQRLHYRVLVHRVK